MNETLQTRHFDTIHQQQTEQTKALTRILIGWEIWIITSAKNRRLKAACAQWSPTAFQFNTHA